MKPSLQLKLSQNLALTPQLQQSIRLLQLSALELEQEVEKYLLENPLLERIEDEYAAKTSLFGEQPTNGSASEMPQSSVDSVDYVPTEESAQDSLHESVFDESSWLDGEATDMGVYARSSGSFDDDEEYAFQDGQVATVSLREHLLDQLRLVKLPERDRLLVRYLIEALDEDGYLDVSLEEIVESLPPELEFELEDLRIALNHLQYFDPLGVGARNAQECLLLQLKAQTVSAPQILASQIVAQHLDLLAKRDFSKLKKLTASDDAQLREAQELICSLNPRPGAQFDANEVRYITPEVFVRKRQGLWVASLNAETYPRLRVHRLYAQMLSSQRGSSLSGQLQEARWLIKNMRQRFDTILRVAQAVVDRQQQFFEYGEVAMRPLVLREIADALELHESTISRVTAQKYMATPRGVFELKYFFGSHVSTETGGACSATAIRAMIKQLVSSEIAKKPLSDGKLADLLGKQGIVVARRTVAKYRESLNIPPVKLRKTL